VGILRKEHVVMRRSSLSGVSGCILFTILLKFETRLRSQATLEGFWGGSNTAAVCGMHVRALTRRAVVTRRVTSGQVCRAIFLLLFFVHFDVRRLLSTALGHVTHEEGVWDVYEGIVPLRYYFRSNFSQALGNSPTCSSEKFPQMGLSYC
jgi:hypothetical protein